MTSMTGGERLVRMLAAESVEVVFGIIDGSYFGLYSTLRDHGIRLVTPRHETSALHMAGAYARLTGRLGVAIASNGPGVANALPGVAVEQGEGNRVLLLTSWRRHQIVGPDRGGTYQYFDQPAVIRPMAKFSEAVPSFDRIPEMFHKALRHSWSGRPGVVHLTIPEDVLNTEFDMTVEDVTPARYRRMQPVGPAAAQVSAAADLLVGAEAPMLHAGSGVLHAHATTELREVAELLHAPVTTSWAARDAIDERLDVAIPMPYSELCDRVRNDADVVLAVGTRFGETDWWGKAPNWRRADSQQLIQVDIDDVLLGMNKPVDIAVQSDAREFLAALAAELRSRDVVPGPARVERLAAYGAARTQARATLDQALATEAAPLHSAQVAGIAQQVCGDDSVLVADGGNTAIWAQLYHQVRQPHSLLSTYKFGMLGAGVAQALGARAARPTATVCCLIGDGAFGFHPLEIETAVRNDLPVIVVVLVDHAWGMVKVNQEFALDAQQLVAEGGLPAEKRINTDLGETRYDTMAQAMGALGFRVDDGAGLRAALGEAIAAQRPAVIHVDVDARAHKFAPSLLTFKAMHAEPAG